jgi:acetyl-CoA carboxylase biotin carboxyl carrier protein
MTLNIDDVLEVLQIVRETKDTELHIDTGEMKLSISRGKVSATGSGFIEQGTVAQAPVAQIEAAAPAAVIAAPVAEPQAEPQAEAQAEAAPAPAADVESEAVSEEGLIPVTADVTSVFYRNPSPEESVYVEVGDEVEEDTIVCLLEVMKCFRQVMAGTRGRVEKICVESSDMVEEGTVMFLIRPA